MTENPDIEGTEAYYTQVGWGDRAGRTVEHDTFGGKEDGPLRQAAWQAKIVRIRDALALAGPPLRLLEGGGGGHPFVEALDLCTHYTNVDFSAEGLAVAERVLSEYDVETELVEADLRAIPKPDAAFDAVYSAYVLFHIADEAHQTRAFEELVRVLRPGGTAVFVVSNPRPLLFPIRFAKRIIADAPVFGAIADRLRPAPLIPYKPFTIRKMRRILEPYGTVSVTTAGIADWAFNQRVTEYSGIGRRLWQLFAWLETTRPRLAARLGNTIQITLVKDTGRT